MGANNTTVKYQRENLYDTPPKAGHRVLFDPRSPTGGISRTPIQIDCQVPEQQRSLKLYNHVMPYITGPDITIPEDNHENIQRVKEEEESEPKRTSGVEPTLDPTKVLTALVESNNGRLPPYQL